MRRLTSFFLTEVMKTFFLSYLTDSSGGQNCQPGDSVLVKREIPITSLERWVWIFYILPLESFHL